MWESLLLPTCAVSREGALQRSVVQQLDRDDEDGLGGHVVLLTLGGLLQLQAEGHRGSLMYF